MNSDSKIYIAGHNGLVGSAILRELKKDGYTNLLTIEHSKLDLTRQKEVEDFIGSQQPEYIFLSAAKVGGIKANSEYPADFYYVNSMISNNIIHSAYQNNVKKLLFLGSSCIYPRLAKQPIQENELMSGPLEPTNEAYALTKISSLKMCDFYRKQYKCNFISAMPTNLYGINDNFDLDSSHLLPALIRKFHEAKVKKSPTVILWGTGTPFREFLHVDDLANALVFLMNNYDESGHVNIGTGEDQTILEIAKLVKKVVGYEGEIVHDLTKPDGMPRKLLDVSKIHKLGWQHRIDLEEGIRLTYNWFKERY